MPEREITRYGTWGYVNCINPGMGWQKMGKGRTTQKCKNACKYYRGMTKTHVTCAWEPGLKRVIYGGV